MNFFDFPPVAALLDAASIALGALGGVVSPGVAIILVTIAVRAAMIPLSLATVRAEGHRRRLAPQLARLKARYATQPDRLRGETLALYAAEKVSPVAGLVPALAQAPVLTLVYALFTSRSIDWHANALLHATLLGAPLGRHLVAAATGFMSTDLIGLTLIVLIGVIAWLSRRATRRIALPVEPAQQRIADILSFTPFLTVIFAALVPLAAAIYLLVSTSWTFLERGVMRRLVWTS